LFSSAVRAGTSKEAVVEFLQRRCTHAVWRRHLAAAADTLKPDSTVLLAIALAICLLFAFAARADDTSQIRSAVVELDQAYANKDVSTIGRMILPDHVSIAARYGGAATVEAQVATFKETEREALDYSPIDIKFLTPGIAIVTFEKSYKGTFQGRPLPSRVSVSEVWLKQQDSTWLQRLYQETAIEGD
jgi:ketosteroid isomerase-like protein